MSEITKCDLKGPRGTKNSLTQLERKYDAQLKIVFEAIRELMEPPSEPPRKRIGYTTEAEGRVRQRR